MNMLTFLYMGYGIPFVYYGTEALFNGGDDPLNREYFDPLVRHLPNLDKLMINHIKTLNTLRRDFRTFDLPPDWRNVESGLLTFTKGSDLLVILTNT